MTDDAIRGMRRSYAADISVIDQAVGDMVEALQRRGILDNTWIIYTSDHGEMGGNHKMMSKCVLYEPAVRGPADHPPPRGCPRSRGCPRGAPRRAGQRAPDRRCTRPARSRRDAPRSSTSPSTTPPRPPARSLTVSELNWGFAAFETERYKLVVDEDARCEPCQLSRPVRGCRGRPRSPARSRRQHPSSRSSWTPTSVRSSVRRRLGPIPEHLHRRVRLNDARPSPARAGPPSAPRPRSGCGGPPPRCGARQAPGVDRGHAGPA